MSYQQYPQHNYGLGATFVPGGTDDYYMPTPELVAPAPQRVMQEDVDQIQNQVAHMELEANARQGSVPPHLMNGSSGYPQRMSSMVNLSAQPHDYSRFSDGTHADMPNFSPFPKIPNLPNVPPSDESKEHILESARVGVLNSNDPEMQLAWAQDALSYCDASSMHLDRISIGKTSRPTTPAVEHQVRLDAMNIVSFLADQHHPKAEFMRGMWLEFGKFGMRIDKKEAFRCYSRAADRQYYRAEYRIGMLFEQSNDPVKALVHYQKGAEAGDSASNYRLGMMTLLGQNGQPQDFSRGIYLIKQAAQTADENAPQGAYVLGMLQARELPQINVPEQYLPYNEKEAKANIEKAAFLGFAKAQLKMGAAYELCTLGCDFDPALSLHYNALAARQAEPEADMAISKWFLCGYEGVFQKNEELAYVYAERAAEAGLATAEFAMGYFNEIGIHVPVNTEKAMEWYDKAAADGNDDAIGRIEGIKRSNTLSKKDHEKIAVNRIRSLHGSKRGQRPDRLSRNNHQPAMPSVSEVTPMSPGYGPGAVTSPSSGRPPRSSSAAPYPLEDKPLVGAPMERPSSAAPYPMDNGPPMPFGGPPEARAASAFNILPSNVPTSPSKRTSQGRPYSIESMGPAGRGHPMAGRGAPGYRQPGGPSVERPERISVSSSSGVPLAGYGVGSPDGRGKLQKPGQAAMGSPVPDIGFTAPVLPRADPKLPQGYERTSTMASPPPGSGVMSPRPGTSSGRPGTAGTAASSGSRPGSSGRPTGPQHAATAPPSKLQQAQAPSSGPSTPAPQVKPAATTSAVKGPKTFEEMGVPQIKENSDCVVM
ncbi:uncharacterized protein K452DRAFT_143788 [Aplosporella prunicola CBS 121167]|uniref:Chitin synthase activator n=1 Tax=Aplosporella prunicola CBS 121167 TaxID=1176127 RepID=A0A6A6BKA5_9PEZI|nr:uncharacterized protein K452DRAFT_143788 [Aplosporella prunicola CBS 121167]KAF2144570.1 hypothetical protein K452DRAFT_143788 [Aplosporella prunicola CBS 121167]